MKIEYNKDDNKHMEIIRKEMALLCYEIMIEWRFYKLVEPDFEYIFEGWEVG
jgi:hypothetical protein